MGVGARLAHPFESAAQQRHAAQLGMWLFLSTEVLLFGGLFAAYGIYRSLYAETFAAASRHLDLLLGTVNTVVLITSSLTVALAHHFARRGEGKASALFLSLSIALGIVFLGVKGVEYGQKIEEGALPGRFYSFPGVQGQGASLFFTLYFLLTGLHGLHVVIGLCVLGWLAVGSLRGAFDAESFTPVELGGMYWHLVDLVWIFLYPLLYLV